MRMKQPLIPPQCIFGGVNEGTPDSTRPNHHPSSRMNVSSISATREPLNLTPPPTVMESKGAEPPTGEEDVTSSSCPWQQKEKKFSPPVPSSKRKIQNRAGAREGQGREGQGVQGSKKLKNI